MRGGKIYHNMWKLLQKFDLALLLKKEGFKDGLCKSQTHVLQPFKNYFKWCNNFTMYGVSSLHYWESIFPLLTCNSSHRHSLKVFHFFLSTSLGHVPISYAVLLCRMYSSFHLNQSFKLKKATNLILSAVIASSFSDNLQAKCIHLQGFRPTAHLD